MDSWLSKNRITWIYTQSPFRYFACRTYLRMAGCYRNREIKNKNYHESDDDVVFLYDVVVEDDDEVDFPWTDGPLVDPKDVG